MLLLEYSSLNPLVAFRPKVLPLSLFLKSLLLLTVKSRDVCIPQMMVGFVGASLSRLRSDAVSKILTPSLCNPDGIANNPDAVSTVCLGHNLFSVGQFCDGELEVAFCSNTCYVRNLDGKDLLTSSRDSNLYTISISEMASSSPVCLMSKAIVTPRQWRKLENAT
ncbi:hypothetical protein Tco_0780217 [Tanacetum coccineum]